MGFRNRTENDLKSLRSMSKNCCPDAEILENRAVPFHFGATYRGRSKTDIVCRSAVHTRGELEKTFASALPPPHL